MCETTWKPDTAIEEQLEQLLHNISTWRDAIDVIDACNELPDNVTRLLGHASGDLNAARNRVRLALSRYSRGTRVLHQEG